jgi:hypothetical protein
LSKDWTSWSGWKNSRGTWENSDLKYCIYLFFKIATDPSLPGPLAEPPLFALCLSLLSSRGETSPFSPFAPLRSIIITVLIRRLSLTYWIALKRCTQSARALKLEPTVIDHSPGNITPLEISYYKLKSLPFLSEIFMHTRQGIVIVLTVLFD